MAKYHITPATGEPHPCAAQEGNCPYGAEAPHFSTAEDARTHYEAMQKVVGNVFPPVGVYLDKRLIPLATVESQAADEFFFYDEGLTELEDFAEVSPEAYPTRYAAEQDFADWAGPRLYREVTHEVFNGRGEVVLTNYSVEVAGFDETKEVFSCLLANGLTPDEAQAVANGRPLARHRWTSPNRRVTVRLVSSY